MGVQKGCNRVVGVPWQLAQAMLGVVRGHIRGVDAVIGAKSVQIACGC